MNKDFPWPSLGDRFFEPRGPYRTTAHINRWTADWMIYAEGYATAAELVVAHTTRVDRNRVVYPVIYLYRHAIELALKYTLVIARKLLNEPGGLQKGHGLNNIWCQVRPLLRQIWREGPEDELRAIDALVKELDANDHNAEKFRYPISKDGKKFFGSDEMINLEVFCESGRKVMNFLDGCSIGIQESLQAKREMQDEYRP